MLSRCMVVPDAPIVVIAWYDTEALYLIWYSYVVMPQP